MITVVMFSLGVFLIGVRDVFVLLLGEKYRTASTILPFLMFNPIMYTISETTVNGLVFKKKSEKHIYIALGACIINLIGNFLLVPFLGGRGAALSTGISYIVFWALRTGLSIKEYYVDYQIKKFVFATACLVLYAAYSTFIGGAIGTTIGGIIMLIILGFTYKATIKEMFEYFMTYVIKPLKTKTVE